MGTWQSKTIRRKWTYIRPSGKSKVRLHATVPPRS
nr:MAG TPA: hypothetical protein [Caudoviricetes sp.]DAM88129.1 MAG TPA: hypothetical protein [Caudoviricetes sp.]